MKKFLFVALFCPFVANAQFTKGQMFLGGSINVQGSNTQANGNDQGGTVRMIGATPKIGYFINDKWALGAVLGYSYQRQAYHQAYPGIITTQVTEDKSFSAGFFGQRYFAVTDKFFIALEGSLAFSRAAHSNVSHSFVFPSGVSSSNTPAYQLNAAISPVFLFFPAPKWGFSAAFGGLNFGHQFTLSDHTSSNTFQFLFFQTVSLGVNYYFNRKGKSE